MAFRKPKPAESEGLLPGYSDLTEIGGGAFATVYRAVETGTGRAVALKILKVDTIHAHLIETFHQEIQALAKVSDHPNIVTLYRPATTTDGRPVLVLELCRGSLASRVRAEGPLDAQDVTRSGVKIAGALETAHRNGFLHRDMKPQNILVTNFGEPALADFGVAALQASAQATAGVFGFTTLHAAPEMLEGQHLSPATDVYGLASTMYQLLTGQAPFATFENEAPASVILRILRDPVRPLRSENIPLALSDLLEAALSKHPEGRPRTAIEFAQALQSVEQAVGWPVTDFLAWGEEGAPVRTGPAPSTAAAASPSAGDAGPAARLAEPGARRELYPTAPSVRVEAVESRSDRLSLPPLLPAATPPAAMRAAPPAAALLGTASPSTPSPSAPSPTRAPAAEVPPAAGPPADVPPGGGSPAEALPEVAAAPAPAPAGPPPGADDQPRPTAAALRTSPPSPPPRRRGPGLASPEPTERQVVAPEHGRRGQPSPPLQKPSEPLAPLSPAVAGPPGPPGAGPSPVPPPAGPPRPVFVDPEPGSQADAHPGRSAESVYEETMAVSRMFTGPAATEAEPAAPNPGMSVWIVAGLAVAVAVLIVAGLILAGIV